MNRLLIDNPEDRAMIALSMVPNVGTGRLRALLAKIGSATEVFQASIQRLSVIDGIGRQTAEAIKNFDVDQAVDEQLERAHRVGAYPITLRDDLFPRLLREIYDPPTLLWVRGELKKVDERALAIVGTRRASDYGKRVAQLFSTDLVMKGFTVVSGLAYGIDIAAHRAAVQAGGRTIAILGSGVDVIYPAKHRATVEQIIDGQGAVISELPLGSPPDAYNFPRRNRLISGMTYGTLVAEAGATGGALLTAWIATEQNRSVFAVPSPIFGGVGEGTNKLIQSGYAMLVTSVEDILKEVGVQVDDSEFAVNEVPPPPSVDLNPLETKLLEALGSEPIHLDTLCEQIGVNPSSALVYLLSLEFKGLIHQMAGKQFYRA